LSTARTRGRATRERLLEATVQLIVEGGWGSVTTRKVAQRAGVQFGVVHYHFSSVSDLLVEASVQFSRTVIAAPLAALAAAPDVPSGLERLLAALDSDDRTTLLLAEAFLAANRDERLRAQLIGVLRDFRAAIAAWLDGHGTSDPDVTAAVLAAALDGLALHRALDPSLRVVTLTEPLIRLTHGRT
jgi:AcrR family transcriptional regulator